MLTGSSRPASCAKPAGPTAALEIARQLEVNYDDAAVFVDLAPVTDPQLVQRAMARALGVREQSDKPLIDSTQDHVGSRRLLVVLDNCEQVLAASSQLADTLVRNCPGLHLLVTSREAMRIHGETAWTPTPWGGYSGSETALLGWARTARAGI